jgi:carbonic anhydrase
MTLVLEGLPMTTQIDADAALADTADADASAGGGGDGKAKRGGPLGPYLPGRREAMFLIGGGVLGAAIGAGGMAITGRTSAGEDRDDTEVLDEKDGRERLEAGNARFVAGTSIHPDQSIDRRDSVATEQAPFAAILTCADSQVPAEVIFDQGLGDLYVVRSAGQVIDHAVLGSLQHGVENLSPALLVVLGHTGCSAVAATVQVVEAEKKAAAKGRTAKNTSETKSSAEKAGTTEGHYVVGSKSAADEKTASLGGEIASLVSAIRPAVVEAEETGADAENLVSVSVDINVERIVEQLKASPLLKEASTLRKVKIVGATYSADSGTVNWL